MGPRVQSVQSVGRDAEYELEHKDWRCQVRWVKKEKEMLDLWKFRQLDLLQFWSTFLTDCPKRGCNVMVHVLWKVHTGLIGSPVGILDQKARNQ